MMRRHTNRGTGRGRPGLYAFGQDFYVKGFIIGTTLEEDGEVDFKKTGAVGESGRGRKAPDERWDD